MQTKFPARRTGYAEPREPRAKVALIDNFEDPQSSLPHGQIVESVMLTHGHLKDEDIQRLHGDSGAPISPQDVFEAPPEEVMDAYTLFSAGALSSFYNMVSDNLETVMNDQPSVRVVNQSQSQDAARLAEPFLQPIFEDQGFRDRMGEALGLQHGSPPERVAEALLGQTGKIMEENEDVIQARERYEEVSHRAFEHGLVDIVAGGNQGELARELEKRHIHTEQNAFRSALVNDWVTVAGAATAGGKISSLNSPGGGAEVYALGENVPFRVEGGVAAANGTSVSAPLIASYAVKLLDEHPEWTPSQVEQAMVSAR